MVGHPLELVAELKRVLKPGGHLLVLVEVNQSPTDCEPHRVTPDLLDVFGPELRCERSEVYRPDGRGMYSAVLHGETTADPNALGWLSALLIKRPC